MKTLGLLGALLFLIINTMDAKSYELHLVFKFYSSKNKLVDLEELRQDFLVNAPGAMYLKAFDAIWEDVDGNIGIKMRSNTPTFSLVFKENGKYMYVRFVLSGDYPNCRTYILDRLFFESHKSIEEALTFSPEKRHITKAGIANLTPQRWKNPLSDSRWKLMSIDGNAYHNSGYYLSFVGEEELIYRCGLRDNVQEHYLVTAGNRLDINISGVCNSRTGSSPLFDRLRRLLHNTHEFEIRENYEQGQSLELKSNKSSLIFRRVF